MTSHAFFRRNCKLSLILTLSAKCKDLLRTLNVYKIPAEKQKIVYRWAAHQVSVSQIIFWKYLEYATLILCNSKQVKKDKNCHIYNFFFFKCPTCLNDNSRTTLRKNKKCPLNIRLLYKALYRVQNISLNITLLQKTKKRDKLQNLRFLNCK